jgi:hypothetical protein
MRVAWSSDGRVLLQVAAGADAGLTTSELDSATAFLLMAVEGAVGLDVLSGAIAGSARLGMLGLARQHAEADWGHRAMFGLMGRFSRQRSTIGPSFEYWLSRVITSSFDPGLCMDEGTYQFRAVEFGGAVDLGFDLGFEQKERVVTTTLGNHYRWSGWAHVHPLTECD